MAFGGSAASYDVKFQANTGQFAADMSVIRREYERTTGVLSTDALKASVAQEKLNRAIARHGPTSLAAQSATLAYRREMGTLGTTSIRTGTSLRGAEHDLDRFSRGALSGTGILRGFGRAAAFASTAFLGGAGLVYAIRRVIQVSNEEQVSLAQTKNALAVNGLSWRQYGGQIEAATAKLETHTAFTKGELDDAFARLVRRTGDVKQALDLTAVAADIARARNISLTQAADLLVKAANGQTAALKRLGIQTVTVTTAQDALKASGVKTSQQQKDQAKATDLLATKETNVALLRKRYSGAAAIYLTTEAGKQALLNARIRDSENIIGTALRPALNHLFGQLATWLDHLNKTGKLQRDVNSAVKDGTNFVHGITDAFNDVKPKIDLVVSSLGGIEHAIETALIVGGVLKVRRFAASFGLITAASNATRNVIVADAAVEQKVLGGVIAEEAAASAGAGFFAGGSGRAGFLAGGAARAGGGLLTGAALYAAAKAALRSPVVKLGRLGAGAVAGLSLVPDQKGLPHAPPFVEGSHWKLGDVDPSGAWKVGRINGQLAWLPVNGGLFAPGGSTPGNATSTRAAAAGAGWLSKPVKLPTLHAPAPVIGLSFADQNALLNAQLTASTGDDRAVYERQRAHLEALLKQPGLTHQNILDIKGQLTGVTDQIRSIDQQNASKASAAASKAAAARRRAAAAYRQGVSTTEQRLKNAVTRAVGPGAPLFTAEGPKLYAAAYAHNRAFAKAGSYQTKLSASEEREFRAWVKANHVPFDVNASEVDYDMRGYWKAMKASHAPPWAGGDTHFPDTFKTPYDTTFSAESKYATSNNPFTWKGNTLVDRRSGKVVFGASPVGPVNAELNFLRKESHDPKLTPLERERFAAQVESERRRIAKEQEARLRAYNKSQAKQLTSIPIDLRIEEETAKAHKASASRLLTIYREEEKAIEQQLVTIKKLGLGKEAILAARTTEAGIQSKINAILKTKGGAGANEKEFLSSFADIISKYAPNSFPVGAGGKTNTHLYDLVTEARRTNKHLSDLKSADAFPASRHAHASAAGVGG